MTTYQQGQQHLLLQLLTSSRAAGILNGSTYYVRGKAVPFWMVYENTGGMYAARSKI